IGPDRRRGFNLVAGREGPFLCPVGIDRVQIVVRGPDVDRAVRPYRRGGAHGIAGGETPLLFSVGIDRVDIAVVRPDIDFAPGADRRRGVYGIAGGKVPLDDSVIRTGIERAESGALRILMEHWP